MHYMALTTHIHRPPRPPMEALMRTQWLSGHVVVLLDWRPIAKDTESPAPGTQESITREAPEPPGGLQIRNELMTPNHWQGKAPCTTSKPPPFQPLGSPPAWADIPFSKH